MRTTDLWRSSLGGLWRQKARTALTLLGVAVGSCALAFSLSLGLGLRSLIDNEFRSRDDFWWVTVFPANRGYRVTPEAEIPADEIAVAGDMPEERRQRLRKKRIEYYRATHPPKDVRLLSAEDVERLKQLPDVDDVRVSRQSSARIEIDDALDTSMVYAGRMEIFDPKLADRLATGRLAQTEKEIVLTESQLYLLGWETEAEQRGAIGKPVKLTIGTDNFQKSAALAGLLTAGSGEVKEQIDGAQARSFAKILEQLPNKLGQFELTPAERDAVKKAMERPRGPAKAAPAATAEFQLVGIVRDVTDAESVEGFPNSFVMRGQYFSAFVTEAGGLRLFDQFQTPEAIGYREAMVKVRPGGDLPGVVDGVQTLGFESYNGLKFYRNVKREVTMIAAGLNLFALISLLVASIGITNTLVTSVLERTREIGIWKALGARDSQILLLFLIEGTALGLFGGVCGLVLAWILSIPGDGFVRGLIQQQSHEALLSTSVFEFPAWLCLSTVGFAVLMTTLAALYPARRASRVQPVEALRYE